MSTTFHPDEFARDSLKQGVQGWDIWAIQVALNSTPGDPKLTEDGIFGGFTKNAVTTLQMRLKILADGIMGPITQATLCARECDAIHGVTPAGLAKGFCFGESSGQITCVSHEYDTTPPRRDYGPMQKNMLVSSSQAALRSAFTIRTVAAAVCETRRVEYEHFLTVPAVKEAVNVQERAWRMAILDFNWPAAASKIAAGKGDSWEYVERGTEVKRKLADRTPWVERESGGRLHTGWDWAKSYVDTKSVYVNSWTVN